MTLVKIVHNIFFNTWCATEDTVFLNKMFSVSKYLNISRFAKPKFESIRLPKKNLLQFNIIYQSYLQ